MTDPAAEPRTAAGLRLYAYLTEGGEKVPAVVRLQIAEDIVAIEAEAASVMVQPLQRVLDAAIEAEAAQPATQSEPAAPSVAPDHDYKTCSMCQEYVKHFLTL